MQPDAVPVINNLALSYALDGKANKAEDLLRKATASGHEDKRVRQNLALVLGLQGKFGEARQIASSDMKDTEAKASMAYLQNMLDKPTRMAALPPDESDEDSTGDEWAPFASAGPAPTAPERKTAAAPAPRPEAVSKTAAAPVQVQVVKPIEAVTAPSPAGSAKVAAQAPAPAQQRAVVTPKLAQAEPKPAPKSPAAASTAVSLLRADID